MEEREKTYAEQDIENTMEMVEDDTLRHTVLEKAKIFKSSWVELGETLAKVAKSKLYESWGYKTLEAYCLKELHIRRNTVAKLIGNYYFLSRNEPKLLEKEQICKLPDFNTMNALAKAKENNKINDDEYQKLKSNAVERGYTAATLHRKIKNIEGETQEQKEERIRKKVQNLLVNIRFLLTEKGDIPQEVNSALSSLETYAKS